MTYIQIAIFSAYTAFIWSRYGVLSSISASSYKLKGTQKGLFTGWLIALAITTLFQPLGIFGGFMAIGFTMAGMSPDHKQDPNTLEDAFHTAGTILAILSGFAGLFFLYGIWIPAIVFIGGSAILYLIRTNWIWWVEILAMGCIAWGLI